MTETSKSQSAPAPCIANVKYGLCARTICLANESKDAFLRLAQAHLDVWRPINEVEDELIEEMVIAKWLQRRYWGIQTATIDLEMAVQAPEFARKYEEAGEMVRQAEALQGIQAKSNTMTLLKRYDSSLNRQFHRAIDQLNKLRARNTFATPPPPADPPILPNEPDSTPKSTIPNNPPPPKTTNAPLGPPQKTTNDPKPANEQRATSNDSLNDSPKDTFSNFPPPKGEA